MERVISVTARYIDFLFGEGDWQLPPTDDSHVGEAVE